ncbi:MAG: DUF4038 domain-containing protein [Gemmatimonadetes bacterium]|nr:DUF4038 domain-containing protein [Gemmatimonadota bacterium]MBT7862468.1 DUF4038 domain-containing protein [Gemmatimonadota bacterium]
MNPPVEVTFHSSRLPANPFLDITLDVAFTDPEGATMRVPAFWAGANQWKVRYASSVPGTHAYRSICHDDDAGLHDVEGAVEIMAYTGDNPLYRHGPLQVSADRRHFEHVDGTPFLWLADTWWKGLSRRLTWEGFQELCADRRAKGFTTVQIVCGPYPDEDAFDPGWANEGGMMYRNREFTDLNTQYFDSADRRLEHLVDVGLMPALVGAWGRADCDAMKVTGVDGLMRHWRYLVARYAAYPLVLVPGGEVPGEAKYGEGDWGEVVSYLCDLDPFKRLKSSHESTCPLREEGSLNDFELVGGSHFSPKSAETLGKFSLRYGEQPKMPLVCGETGYEGHMQRHFADAQRYVFWMYMLSGAAGHTYGAAGLHHMGIEGDPGLKPIWDYTTWQEAMDFPGAAQVGMGGKLLRDYPWHRFEPHPEWSDQDCFAAGVPGEVRFIYRSNRSVYDWTGPRIRNLEEGIPYRAFYFDPATGRRFDLGTIRRVADHPRSFDGHTGEAILEDRLEEPAAWVDLGKPSGHKEVPSGVATEKGEAWLTNMVSVHKEVSEKDVMVSVEAGSHAEAGILVRFQDLANYVVGLYSPTLKAIYFLERRAGAVAPFFIYRIPHLGLVDVPEIGESFTLAAAACGDYVAMRLDDGKRSYHTPPVRVANVSTGQLGLWRSDIGEPQEYRNIRVSRTRFTNPPEDETEMEEGLHLIRSGEDVAPAIPSPQDWVLVMETDED